MKVLHTTVLVGLLVAGYVGANVTRVSDAKTVQSELQAKEFSYTSRDQFRHLNESLRLVLNNICSLAGVGFEHRNMTPAELYYYLQKQLDNYKKISDEMENFCKVNKIKPCYFDIEKNPANLVNILGGFRHEHELAPELPKI